MWSLGGGGGCTGKDCEPVEVDEGGSRIIRVVNWSVIGSQILNIEYQIDSQL